MNGATTTVTDDDGYFWPRTRRRRSTPYGLLPGTSATKIPLRGSQSVALSDPTPLWGDPTISRLTQLLELEPGWDGYNASAIRRDIVDFCLQMMLRTFDYETPAPQIVPLAGGGLQLEWHLREFDLEVEIAAPNDALMLFEDRRTGESNEQPLSSDFEPLASIVRKLG